MRRQHSITARAVAFVVLVCLCLILMDSWRSWNARAVQLAEMNVETANLSRAMAQQADDTIKEADVALLGIVERVVHDGTGPAALLRLHAFLMLEAAELDQIDDFSVYDERGQRLATNLPTSSHPINIADRSYFLFHKTHMDIGPYIDRPIRSRGTGNWVIPVSRRIDRADGSFAGVALATIKISFLRDFYDTLDIGRYGAAVLVSDEGTLLVRRPYRESLIGLDMRPGKLFQTYTLHRPVGTALITSNQDGITRINSFRRLEHYPLFVAAALSKDEILADWWYDTLWHSAGVLMLVAVVGLFGWRFVEQIRRRERAEAEAILAHEALARLNLTLETLAQQDSLTGLANRRHFDETLAGEFARMARNSHFLGLIMIDVDYFKAYNDRYGHLAGDECLRLLSRTIEGTACKRPGDLACRYGGEEIAVVLPDTKLEGVLSVAQEVHAGIQALALSHADSPFGCVTVSLGVAAIIPKPDSDPNALIQVADEALYRAKSTGRNRVCVADAAVLSATVTPGDSAP